MARPLHPRARAAGRLAVVALALLPVALLLTIVLVPLWRAVEAHAGIESVGHSGPASWCYVATWLALLVPAATLVLARRDAAR